MGRNRICLRVKGMGSTRSLLTVFAAGVLMVAPPCNGAARASSSDYEIAWIEDFLEGVGRVDWSADGVWIAFDHREPGDYFDVYRIRADRTGGVECLTCDHPYLPNLQQGNPAYHPGGRWLLFQAAKKDYLEAPGITNPGRGAYNDLWVMDLESTPPYDVYPLTDVSPDDPPGGSLHAHFSRDGTRLLWGDLQDAAECYGDWRIAVASFVPTPFPHLDMETIQYYEPGDEMKWYEVQDWSPDDSCIYFSAAPLAGQDDRGQDFCYMDLSSGALTRLTETSGRNGEEKEWDEHGKLTPRGDAIVWMTSEDYGTIPDDTCNHVANLNTDLWIMNPDGSGKIKLTRYNDPLSSDYVGGGVCVSDHSWNPDGTKLAVEVFFRGTPRADLKIFHFDLADPSATPSPSPTGSATVTSTKTPTSTPTNTPTSTHTMSPTSTPTAGASGTPTPTPTKTATPTPTSLSFTLRFTFQPYGAETPPYSMKDWGQSYGDDEEAGDVPGSGIEIEYGWL